jgi:predicted RNase H-like nuclease (RuvC/YqgF family)
LERVGHAEFVRLVVGLLERVEVLEAENAALRAENAAFEAEDAELKARIAKLEEQVRSNKRASAPFSKGRCKADPKKPGRKKGVGTFSRRPEPEP